jgi:hypothetical protein
MNDEDKTEVQTQETKELESVASEGVDPRLVVEPEEAVESEEPEEEPEEVEPEPEEPAPVSHRENKRIQDLTRKLAESNRTQPSQPQPSSQIIGEGDYDLDQINQLARDHGDARYNEALERSRAIEFKLGLKVEAPIVAQKYDELNPKSDNFDLGRREFIDELYLKSTGYNEKTGTVQRTDIGYEEFVDGIMDMVDRSASAKSADTTKNLAKQASQTGIRPNSVAKKTYQGTDPKKMTDDQLRQAINASLGI